MPLSICNLFCATHYETHCNKPIRINNQKCILKFWSSGALYALLISDPEHIYRVYECNLIRVYVSSSILIVSIMTIHSNFLIVFPVFSSVSAFCSTHHMKYHMQYTARICGHMRLLHIRTPAVVTELRTEHSRALKKFEAQLRYL